MIKLILLMILDGMIPMPVSIEIVFFYSMQQQKSSLTESQQQKIFVFFTTIGGIFGYLIGKLMVCLENGIQKEYSKLIISKIENMIYGIPIEKLLIFKSFIPIPAFLINICCGIKNINLIYFVILTVIIKALRIKIAKRIYNIYHISEIKALVCVFTISSTLLAINAITRYLI